MANNILLVDICSMLGSSTIVLDHVVWMYVSMYLYTYICVCVCVSTSIIFLLFMQQLKVTSKN